MPTNVIPAFLHAPPHPWHHRFLSSSSSAPIPLASGLQPTWRVSSSVVITSNITLFRKTPNFWNLVGIYAPTPPSYSLLLFIFSIAPTGLEHALKFSYFLFLLLTGCLCFWGDNLTVAGNPWVPVPVPRCRIPRWINQWKDTCTPMVIEHSSQ